MNFPSRHPLNQSSRGRAVLTEADVILGLELTDFWGTVNSYRDQLAMPIVSFKTFSGVLHHQVLGKVHEILQLHQEYMDQVL